MSKVSAPEGENSDADPTCHQPTKTSPPARCCTFPWLSERIPGPGWVYDRTRLAVCAARSSATSSPRDWSAWLGPASLSKMLIDPSALSVASCCQATLTPAPSRYTAHVLRDEISRSPPGSGSIELMWT